MTARHYEHPDLESRVFGADHEVETTDQIRDAVENLYRPDDQWVPWPWPDLTKLMGRMKPRDVWFVCAFSGNGKTLFVSSTVHENINHGIKTYVLPLETAADDFRQYLACQRVGIDPGLVNEGGLLDMSPELRRYWEQKIEEDLYRQATDAAVRSSLKVKGVDEINLTRLTLAAQEAHEWGARVLIVDHIDHIEDGDGKNPYAESVRVNKAAKKLAKRYNLIFLFTSQMNTQMLTGGRDRLAQFGPPMPHHVFMGGHKRHNATGMLGLHRRLRDQGESETTEEFHAALKRSREGEAPPLEALQPGVMAVTAMKLRNGGAREGQRCFLAVEHGRVNALPERDRVSTTYDAMRRQ